jgi:coenzyme F420-reducing hydrogenase alpha subunit
MAETRRIEIGALARVEGEGALHVRVEGEEVTDVRLEIYEPPRFFEALLRGRPYSDAPDITSRICGICPIAYQVSAINAMEDALGVEVPESIRALRRLIYCGEWLESHGLHAFMLHAPDFLGYEGAIEMARAEHPEPVERGLRIKRAGNEILRTIGGRAVHPINLRVGGFHRLPRPDELAGLRRELVAVREDLRDALAWTGTLDFPDHELDVEMVALSTGYEYAIEDGRLVSDRGLDIAPAEFTDHVVEEQIPHSTALHARIRDRGNYLVGPLARWNLNSHLMPEPVREAAAAAGLEGRCANPFRSISVRCAEMLFAAEEAIRLIDSYDPPPAPAVPVEPRAGVGSGWSEAPRGVCWHRYELDDDGRIERATIVPPTSQNQASIERDLASFVRENLALDDERLRLRCEQAVRNYDPCISCSTHFLELDIERVPPGGPA